MLIGSILNPLLGGTQKPQIPQVAPPPEPAKDKPSVSDPAEATKFTFSEQALNAAANAASGVNRAAEVVAATVASGALAAPTSGSASGNGSAGTTATAAAATRSPTLYQQETLASQDEDAIRAWAEQMQSREQASKLIVLNPAKPIAAANVPGAPTVAKFLAGEAAMASAPALPKALATA